VVPHINNILKVHEALLISILFYPEMQYCNLIITFWEESRIKMQESRDKKARENKKDVIARYEDNRPAGSSLMPLKTNTN
jgi:hypothetical protein